MLRYITVGQGRVRKVSVGQDKVHDNGTYCDMQPCLSLHSRIHEVDEFCLEALISALPTPQHSSLPWLSLPFPLPLLFLTVFVLPILTVLALPCQAVLALSHLYCSYIFSGCPCEAISERRGGVDNSSLIRIPLFPSNFHRREGGSAIPYGTVKKVRKSHPLLQWMNERGGYEASTPQSKTVLIELQLIRHKDKCLLWAPVWRSK